MKRRLQNSSECGIEVLKLTFEPGNFEDTANLHKIRRSGVRIVLVMAYDTDMETVALSAHRAMMTRGFAWISIESVSEASLYLVGWLYLRPRLPEGMQAFAEQVIQSTTARFQPRAEDCEDRSDTSEHNTTCAESLPYCQSPGTFFLLLGLSSACPSSAPSYDMLWQAYTGIFRLRPTHKHVQRHVGCVLHGRYLRAVTWWTSPSLWRCMTRSCCKICS